MVTTQKLTALGINSLSAPGLYSDGGGLNLRIAPGGSKRWVLRLQIDGKRRDLGLGGYPAVSLANARRKAESMREIAADGRDPTRDKAAVPTFKEAALTVHAQSLPGCATANTRINGSRRLSFTPSRRLGGCAWTGSNAAT